MLNLGVICSHIAIRSENVQSLETILVDNSEFIAEFTSLDLIPIHDSQKYQIKRTSSTCANQGEYPLRCSSILRTPNPFARKKTFKL